MTFIEIHRMQSIWTTWRYFFVLCQSSLSQFEVDVTAHHCHRFSFFSFSYLIPFRRSIVSSLNPIKFYRVHSINEYSRSDLRKKLPSVHQPILRNVPITALITSTQISKSRNTRIKEEVRSLYGVVNCAPALALCVSIPILPRILQSKQKLFC